MGSNSQMSNRKRVPRIKGRLVREIPARGRRDRVLREVLSDTDGDKLCVAPFMFSFFGSEGPGAWWALPSDVYWLARPLLDVLALDDAVLASAVSSTLERGLEPATKPEGTSPRRRVDR